MHIKKICSKRKKSLLQLDNKDDKNVYVINHVRF